MIMSQARRVKDQPGSPHEKNAGHLFPMNCRLTGNGCRWDSASNPRNLRPTAHRA